MEYFRKEDQTQSMRTCVACENFSERNSLQTFSEFADEKNFQKTSFLNERLGKDYFVKLMDLLIEKTQNNKFVVCPTCLTNFVESWLWKLQKKYWSRDYGMWCDIEYYKNWEADIPFNWLSLFKALRKCTCDEFSLTIFSKSF